LNDVTFQIARQRAEKETGIEHMDKTDALWFCMDAVVDIVKDYRTAGQRTTETFTVEGGMYTPEHEVAFVLSLASNRGGRLSPNSEYELLPDNTFLLPNGEYTLIYTAFPEMGRLTEQDAIPLPKMFQEAVHWYLAHKYHGRLMGEVEASTSYFAETFNQVCRAADQYYAGRRTGRRIPCKMIG
jgi:hypothetical protein